MLLGILSLLVGAPLLYMAIWVGWKKRLTPRSSRLLLGIGIGIACLDVLAILVCVLWIGPGRSGILVQGMSPEGQQYCVVQTYKDMVEPYQVSFYIRDAAGIWRWNYLEHEDVAWRSASVSFSNGYAHVSRNGVPFRDIALPTNTVDLAQIAPGYRDDYCPADFTVDDVLSFHNQQFQ